MGIIISRFRKKPTTLEQLKKIEDGLRKIEDYKKSTERKQKRTVANLVIYGVALYILACVIVFVWYLPESWLVRLALLIPLVLVPLIIYWIKRIISRYFESRMVRADEEYVDLQKKKKGLIDSVMETETFNKAKEILSKYAPEKLEKRESAIHSGAVAIKTSPTDLRKRTPLSSNAATSKLQWIAPVESGLQRTSPLRPSNVEPLSTHKQGNLVPFIPLSQPIFPKNRSLGDKLVEYIVGDGPSYRYALICKFCREHNGMALQEEFPYMSFACCYCRKLNPARTSRPSAPRLPDPENQRKILSVCDSKPPVTNKPFPKPIAFDQFMDQLDTQQSQDADQDTASVSTSVNRISNDMPNKDKEEGSTETNDVSDEDPKTSDDDNSKDIVNKDSREENIGSHKSLLGMVPITEVSLEKSENPSRKEMEDDTCNDNSTESLDMNS